MSDEAYATGENGRRLDRVRLVGVQATGYHGVFDHERGAGQTFVADVVVHLDTRRAAATDDLAHTLDYGTLAEQVVGVLAGEPVDLIETVAERIAATVLAHPQVQAVDVAVHKPQAPIAAPFRDVVVEVRRDRSWLPAAEPLRADARPWRPEPAERDRPGAAVGDTGTAAGVAPIEPPGPPGPAATAALSLLTAAPPVVPPTPPTASAAPLGAAPLGAVPTGDDPRARESDPDADEVVEAELVADALDTAPEVPVEVVLAIGANLGAAQDTLRDAVAELAAVPGVEVLDVSALARTAPVGGPDQPDFLNAVVIARTTLSPRDLLRATAEVERVHGRERITYWGPRTLDIDIIVYGQVSAVTDDLELPHPRAHSRAFVLQPWAQVRPDAVLHGLGGGPVAALAATAPDRDGVRWLALDWLTTPVPAAQPDVGADPDANEAAVGPLDGAGSEHGADSGGIAESPPHVPSRWPDRGEQPTSRLDP